MKKGLIWLFILVKVAIYLLGIEEAADLNNLSVEIEFEDIDVFVVEGVACKTMSKQISPCHI